MRQVAIETFVILDFEASSLSAESWPIEVGLSWLEDREVRTWSSLIRPASGWPLSDWSVQSAAVHGIPLDQIAHAPSVTEVTKTFLMIVGGRTLVSDAPAFEARWLNRLLQAADRDQETTIEDYDAVTFALFSGLSLDMVYEALARRPAPHRAGLDSARLAHAWKQGLRKATAMQ